MKYEISFSASASGVRRAARRVTRSLTAGSSCQAFSASSIDGPAHTAATESSGTLIWLHGQSGKRGSAASAAPRKATSMAMATTGNQHLMRHLQVRPVVQEILVTDRRQGSRRA